MEELYDSVHGFDSRPEPAKYKVDSFQYRPSDEVNQRNRAEDLQRQSLHSLKHAAPVVDRFDEFFRSGGFQRAPPLNLKEHFQNSGRGRRGCQACSLGISLQNLCWCEDRRMCGLCRHNVDWALAHLQSAGVGVSPTSRTSAVPLPSTLGSRVYVQPVGLNAETKKGSAPTRRGNVSLDIPLYRTFPVTAFGLLQVVRLSTAALACSFHR
jgi:hypothetical protein